jgi:hypothetical protein
VSLDHDGLLIAYRGKTDIHALAKYLISEISPWVDFFLSKEGLPMKVPIEPKLLIVDGEIFKT